MRLRLSPEKTVITNAREMSGFGLCPGLLVGGHVE
jgi:hypothetical protein